MDNAGDDPSATKVEIAAQGRTFMSRRRQPVFEMTQREVESGFLKNTSAQETHNTHAAVSYVDL